MQLTFNKIIYGNLKSENSQDYAQNPQRNCTFMNSSSGQGLVKTSGWLLQIYTHGQQHQVVMAFLELISGKHCTVYNAHGPLIFLIGES